MNPEDAIRHEFRRGELQYIDAIQRLESLGYLSEDAEALVGEWKEEIDVDACDEDAGLR